jgi:hypothetical protein
LNVDTFFSRFISLVSSFSLIALAIHLIFWCWTHT